MKKLFLFFTIFLFFGFLSAEEAQKYASENAEAAPKAAETTDSSDVLKKNIKPKEFFYFQPLLEGRVGIFNEIGLGFDTGFLVASTEVSDIYTGFSARAVTNVGDALVDLLFLPKLDFNFKLKDRYLDWIAFWFGLGAEFNFEQSAVSTSEDNVHWIPDIYFDVSCLPAWGIGVDLIFKNYIVLKLGISSFAIMWPELMLGLGYRF